MNRPAIHTVVEAIAGDLLALSQVVLEDDRIGVNIKTGQNTLRDSALRADLQTIVKSFDNPVITALFNNYVVFLEWDRPPKYGKRPPIDALRDWAASKGIPTDASTLWVISNAIWRDGHAGRPIFATIDTEVDILFADDWADRLFDAIALDLDKLFK